MITKLKFIGKIFFVFFICFFVRTYQTPVYANHPPDGAHSTFSVSSSSSNQIPADGSTTANITIELHDNVNDPCIGDSISLTSPNDSSALFDPSFRSSDDTGKVTFTMTSTRIGTTTINVFDSTVNATLTNFGQVTFVQAPSVTPTPSPTPLCNDAAPASAPQLISAVQSSSGKVVLTWKLASDPVSYYLLSYGVKKGDYIYGQPNIGGQGTTSFTVSSLTSGKTYYFAVKAVNGCKSSDYSNELSATIGGTTTKKTTTPTLEASNETQILASPTAVLVSDTPILSPTQIPQNSLFVSMNSTFLMGGIIGVGIVILIIGGILYLRSKNSP
jgi:hypothetical protein